MAQKWMLLAIFGSFGYLFTEGFFLDVTCQDAFIFHDRNVSVRCTVDYGSIPVLSPKNCRVQPLDILRLEDNLYQVVSCEECTYKNDTMIAQIKIPNPRAGEYQVYMLTDCGGFGRASFNLTVREENGTKDQCANKEYLGFGTNWQKRELAAAYGGLSICFLLVIILLLLKEKGYLSLLLLKYSKPIAQSMFTKSMDAGMNFNKEEGGPKDII
ncbi:uncharacterized protein LOC134076193 [Sardina pilchardus]|uniref:uncharacterized protein LOC134076193 n=1 Tax=Sardina pilchardus TaxID=27697 RepID=UPI002E1152BD